ncbi:MAG: acetylglutamate kinase [Cyclobacteriaceae bacterium]|nr:acetylglutamate kinase [Cyclobacteriaceae bacterium]
MKRLRIFKVGGNVVEDHKRLQLFLKNFAAISGSKLLVHGGGKWVSATCEKLGIPVKMVEGRRITDAETLEVVKMMLAGVANKNVVAALQALGCNAIGLTGADGNTIMAHKRPLKNGIDFGWVGDVDSVNSTIIHALLDAGLCPVFAAMTHDAQGNLFNTNADTIASTLATGMSALYETELVYCFELPGVLKKIDDPQSLIQKIDSNNIDGLKNEGIISGGMIPKIDNAFDALRSGVKAVRICNADDIQHFDQGSGPGTLISL